MKAGQTLFTPAVRHLPENVTDNDMEVILAEPKRVSQPRRNLQVRARQQTAISNELCPGRVAQTSVCDSCR